MPINIVQRLLPRGEDFTRHFCALADQLLRAGSGLRELIAGGAVAEADVSRMKAIEEAGDEITRRIIVAANRTFNAPIDREDILALAQALDDALDLIEDVTKSIHRSGLKGFSSPFSEIAGDIVVGLDLVQETLPLLDDIPKNYERISAACEKIGAAEGRSDDAFDRGLVELRAQMKGGGLELLEYLDRKEVLELLEEVSDRCDDIAKALRTVTAKHV
jgi:uncharacterized protein Yka (UPF0111/DUF47 family)